MTKTYSDAMPVDATADDWAKRPKAEIITAMLLLQANMGGQINALTAMRGEHAEMTEKLENANMMLSARSTELDRSQKIAAEMSATVAKQRDEIRECNAEINNGRKNIDGLKTRLFRSELECARLSGRLERVRETDRLRLIAIGKLPQEQRDMHGRTTTDTVMGVARDEDWVTF